MTHIFSNWNFFRALRLIAGISILAYGYTVMDWLLIMIGFVFAFMAISNSQCGPFSNSCSVQQKSKNRNEPT